jgi:hypothetical protein
MQAAAREHHYLKPGAALAAASVVALAPIAAVTPLPSPLSAVERAVHLTADGDSILNVPFNLFQDFVNIGANEIAAEDALSKSLFYATNFFVPSATNIFGTDPGDLLHYNSIFGLLFPFSRDLSGIGSPVLDPTDMANGTEPLAQQISLLAAAELPTSASSDADWSSPIAPATPITGLAGIDRLIWSLEIFTGGQKFPILDNFLQIPLSKLMSGDFTFTDGNVPGGISGGALADPSEGPGYLDAEGNPVRGGVPSDDVFGGIGTKPLEGDAGYGVNDYGQALNAAGNPINLMPWTGDTFKLDLSEPFQAFFKSLMAPVDSSDFAFHYGLPADLPDGVAAPLDGFTLPSLQDIIQAYAALAASFIVAFDPFTAGSPLCAAACTTDGFGYIVDAVKAIGQLAGGNNPLINHWLDLVNTPSPDVGVDNPNVDMTGAQTGSINYATPHEILADQSYLEGQQNLFDFGNPPPSDPPLSGPLGVDTPLPFDINPAIQQLIDFMQTSGIQSFVHEIADLFGYQPLDYGDTFDSTPGMTDMGDAGATAATATTDLSNLWTELTNPADWGSLF